MPLETQQYEMLSDAVKTALGRRNVVINGGLDVNQRGFTTQSPVPNTSFTYFADRHLLYNDDGTGAVDMSRSADVPSGEGFSTSVNVTVNTALASPGTGNELVIVTKIEGYDYRALEASGYLTASFWVKSNKTGIYSYSIKNTGADRVYVTEFTVDAVNTWEKKTITIPLDYSGGTWDYTNGIGLVCIITLMTNSALQASSNDTWITSNTPASANQVNFMDTVANVFKMTGLQIEAGQVATPFEQRSYGEELALCQRYYWRGYASGNGFSYKYGPAGGSFYDVNNIIFPVPMRAVPTCSVVTTPTYNNCSFTDLQVGSAGAIGFVERVTVTAAGSYRATSGVYEADAEL